MGMPVTIEVVDRQVSTENIEQLYSYLSGIDEQFSTYKPTSEISRLNAGTLLEDEWSDELKEVLDACEKTKQETNGYFDIHRQAKLDPSGYVKGWAIQNTASRAKSMGLSNYYINIGGDIQVAGHNNEGNYWVIGIRNPFNQEEIIKRVLLQNKGIATSGTYLQGEHIYNPYTSEQEHSEIVSLTVICDSVTDADRYATAAFAMGEQGIGFIASLDGFEAYQINIKGIATFTNGFNAYVLCP